MKREHKDQFRKDFEVVKSDKLKKTSLDLAYEAVGNVEKNRKPLVFGKYR